MPRMVRLIWILLALHLALGMIAYAHFLVTGRYVCWAGTFRRWAHCSFW